MHLRRGAEQWLIGKYLIHQGNNSRNGVVLRVEGIENRYEGRGPKMTELVVRVKPEPSYWPETTGTYVSSVRYALRNLPDELLEMSDQERAYYDPIFALFDIATGTTYITDVLDNGEPNFGMENTHHQNDDPLALSKFVSKPDMRPKEF
jgi:hypothetical protein